MTTPPPPTHPEAREAMAEPAPRDWQADRALCEAATPGPWLHIDIEGGAYEFKVISAPPDRDAFVREIAQMPEADDRTDDFNFIAESRTGWPAALEELERLQAIVDAYAAAHARYHGKWVNEADSTATFQALAEAKQALLAAAEARVLELGQDRQDLAALARRMLRHVPDVMERQVRDYLKRKGLQGSVLRDDEMVRRIAELNAALPTVQDAAQALIQAGKARPTLAEAEENISRLAGLPPED